MSDINISLENGKYDIAFCNGNIIVNRYGQEWRNETGDKLILALCHEVIRLREQNERVKKLFTYLDQVEESSSGREFRPVYISCCRSMQTKPIQDLLAALKEGTK